MTRLGADPTSTRAYVSPCLSAHRFEVGEDVAAMFDERYVLQRGEWSKPHVDYKRLVADQCRRAGVTNIQVDPGCTLAEGNMYYSHRGGARGARMLGFISLRGPPRRL
eukprot:jgi/Chlat1/8775/Chrsp90S08127